MAKMVARRTRGGLVLESRLLGDAGWSNVDIAVKMDANKKDISRWCAKIPIKGAKPLNFFEEKRKALYYLDRIDSNKLRKSNARLLAALLYWCEGAKYPSSSRVDFVCSDEKLVSLFLFLLRKGFDLDESKFRVMLQIHTDHDVEQVFKYWSGILNIPRDKFIRPTITQKKGGKYRRFYMGTCSLRYGDYSVLIRLMGIYSRFTSKLLDLD